MNDLQATLEEARATENAARSAVREAHSKLAELTQRESELGTGVVTAPDDKIPDLVRGLSEVRAFIEAWRSREISRESAARDASEARARVEADYLEAERGQLVGQCEACDKAIVNLITDFAGRCAYRPNLITDSGGT